MKKFLKKIIPRPLIHRLNRFRVNVLNGFVFASNPYIAMIHTYINLARNSRKKDRKLEIGPGLERIAGFETVNITWGKNVDYVVDASKRMPFEENTFQIVYASHILEHIPWMNIEQTLSEWFRIIKKGGRLEIWVPDGYKLAKLLCDIEEDKVRDEWNDDWRPFNTEGSPYKWVNGRLLYGANPSYPSWHLSVLTKKYLYDLLNHTGFEDIRCLEPSEVRGYDHGWINLGLSGRKP